MRKFEFGNVGASFKLLKGQRPEKIIPTSDEIEELFPQAKEGKKLGLTKYDERILKIKIKHLRKIISGLPRDKASGPSQLSYDHIKYACNRDSGIMDHLRETLEHIVNNPEKADKNCFRADAHFIRKSNGKIRPIVLQETLMRILHKYLNKAILKELPRKDFSSQYCILTKNATTTAALRVDRYMNSNGTKYAIAIDFTNAFNSIEREHIVSYMKKAKITPAIIRYVTTYLNRFTLMNEGKTIKNLRGVPQGCPMSMTLFAMGTTHLLQELEAKGVTVVAYADDIVIMSEDKDKLLKTFEEFIPKAEKAGLTINRGKTKMYTTGKSEEGFASLEEIPWTYLGIPIATKKELIKDEVNKLLDDIEEDAKKAWKAPLLHQSFFIYKTCVQSRVTHMLRGADLGNDTHFLRDRQIRLDALLPDTFRIVPHPLRIQSVKTGGLGFTDLTLTQNAARAALLQETWDTELAPEIKEYLESKEEQMKENYQAQLTSLLREVTLEKHTIKAHYQSGKSRVGLNAPEPENSIWLSTPPLNPSQVLQNTAFRIAIMQRYGIDPLNDSKYNCPVCGLPITLDHTLNCKKPNSGIHIRRHNTINHILGATMAHNGYIVRYEQKPMIRKKGEPHIPDITYQIDGTSKYIDIAIHKAYGRDKDTRQSGYRAKKRTYEKTWGQNNKDVMYLIFDNAARLGPGAYDNLGKLGVRDGIIKVMQLCILQANEISYQKIMGLLAESMEDLHPRNKINTMVPKHFVEDAITLN